MANNTARIQLAAYLNGSGFNNRNYVKNPSSHLNQTQNIVLGAGVSAGDVTRNTSSPLTAISDFQIVLNSATNEYVEWTLDTIDRADQNGNCEFSGSYKLSLGSGATVQAQVWQNSVMVASSDLPAESASRRFLLNVPCGTSTTTVRFAQTVTTNTSTLNVAALYYGRASNVGSVAQATLYGTISWAGVSSCQWTTASTSGGTYVDFPVDSDCSDPVVTGGVTAPGTKVPEFTLNGMPAGNYMVVFSGDFGNGGANVGWRLNDGTNTYWMGGGSSGQQATFSANISVTAAQSKTYRMQWTSFGSASSGYIQNEFTGKSLEIKVYRYPSSSEVAVSINQQDTQFADYTPTYNTGTWTTNLAKWRRRGNNMEVQLKATNTAAGSGTYTFSIPSVGATINTTAVPTSTIGNAITSHTLNAGPVGGGNWSLSSNLQLYGDCSVYVVSTTAVSVLCGTAASSGFSSNGNPYSDRASGLGSSVAGAGSSAYVTISISIPINEWIGQPVPVLVGSVTSSSTGAERIERARIANNGTATITSQSGSWLTSASRSALGTVDLVIASGIFSATPACTVSILTSGSNGYVINITNLTSTALTTKSNDPGVANSDRDFTVICMGPR